MRPSYEVVGASDAPSSVVFVHGILGSKNNWRGFVRGLVGARSDVRAVIVDLPNHGDSPSAPGPHTLAACADVLDGLNDALGPVAAVVGHSFGGKVALTWAARTPPGLRQVWVLDASPSRKEVLSGEIAALLTTVEQIGVPIESRAALVRVLCAAGVAEPVALWMTTNLRPVEGGYGWRFRLEAIPDMLASYGSADLWGVLERGPPPAAFLVRGGRSDRIGPEDQSRIAQLSRDGRLRAFTLEEAGHWLHTDAPAALQALLAAELP